MLRTEAAPSTAPRPGMALLRKLADVLALRRSMVGLLAMVVMVGMGERMADRFLPIYLIALGSGALWPGLLNGLNNLLGALYAYPGGWLADHFGVKRSLLLFNFLAIAGYAIVVAIPRWQAVIAGSFLFLSWTAISLPGTMGLISNVLPKGKQVMGVSLHSLVRRIPMAAGPVLGGVFIDAWGAVTGVRVAFSCAIGMALVAIVMQQVLILKDQPAEGHTTESNPFRLLRTFSPDLKSLLTADLLIRLCEQIPYAYVVLWSMGEIAGYTTARVTATQFGLLTTIEMAVAVVCYIPVARLADKGSKKPFVVITFVNFALFPLVLLFCRSFEALILAFVVRGLKEFGEPTRKALILELAPEGRKAAAFGAYYLVRDSLVSVAVFGGAYLWELGPAVNFLAAFACGICGAIWFSLFGNRCEPGSGTFGTGSLRL